MKATVSAKKNLQGSETDTRELLRGTKEKERCSLDKGAWICPPGKSIFYIKIKGKNELVARPE